MTGTTPQGFELDRDFAAPPSVIFAVWTTSEHFSRWFGGTDVQVPTDRLDWRPTGGGTWSATMMLPDGTTFVFFGEFVEVVPDQRLVFTMTDEPDKPDRVTITVELSPTESGTHLRMTQQSPTFTDEEREGALAGWQTVLDVLREIVEVA
jgi:uncharacterized protein YndB with AHSA1/START domain